MSEGTQSTKLTASGSTALGTHLATVRPKTIKLGASPESETSVQAPADPASPVNTQPKPAVKTSTATKSAPTPGVALPFAKPTPHKPASAPAAGKSTTQGKKTPVTTTPGTAAAAAKPAGKPAAKKTTKAAAKPAAKKTASKKATTKPAAKTTAKPTAKKPVAKKAASKPAAKSPVAKKAASKPVAKKPVAKKPATKPAAKKPAAKTTAKPVAKKPVAKKPVAKKATAKKPVATKPATAAKKATATAKKAATTARKTVSAAARKAPTRASNPKKSSGAASARISAAGKSLGEQVYRRVEEIIATGKTAKAAFDVVAKEQKMSVANVQQHYYRFKRKAGTKAKSANSRARASVTRALPTKQVEQLGRKLRETEVDLAALGAEVVTAFSKLLDEARKDPRFRSLEKNVVQMLTR